MYTNLILFIFTVFFALKYLRIFVYMKGNKFYFYNRTELFCKVFDIEIKQTRPVICKFSMPYNIEEKLIITL